MEPVERSVLSAQLRRRFQSGVTRSQTWRRRQLLALQRAIIEQEEAIVEALATDLGKSAAESKLTELQPALLEISLALQNLALWAAPRVVEPVVTPWYLAPAYWLRRVWRALLPRALGGLQPVGSYGGAALSTVLERRYVVPEPLGVALIITAWNYPLLLPVWHMTSAIAAGNCVVVKPSEHAPATAKLLADLVHTYLDHDCIRVVLGDASIAQQLLTFQTETREDDSYRRWAQARSWDVVHYTGGWRIGRQIALACAQQLIPCILELGGKNPLVIDAVSLTERDLGRVARLTAWAKFLNAGQTCIAPDYVVMCGASAVQEAFFIEKFRQAIEGFYGASVERCEHYPRIVNAAHTCRLADLLKRTKGKIVFGGEYRESDRFVHPTLIREVALDDVLMMEEIFGPILPLLQSCADVEQALSIISTLPPPLTLYLMSNDRTVIGRFERETTSGSLVVNDLLGQVVSPGLPFGGVASSGMGKSKGQAGFDGFSHLKSFSHKPLWMETIATDRYHPLNDRKIRRLHGLVSLPNPAGAT